MSVPINRASARTVVGKSAPAQSMFRDHRSNNELNTRLIPRTSRSPLNRYAKPTRSRRSRQSVAALGAERGPELPLFGNVDLRDPAQRGLELELIQVVRVAHVPVQAHLLAAELLFRKGRTRIRAP